MIASISLDLDNKWSYMKTHGDAGWEAFPTYLQVVVPRVLKLLKELDLTITFFVVGQDADRPENVAALRSIADAGHEIGNHSFHHEPWLHLYSKDQINEEFERSERAIELATGQRTIGFRGPGFSYSQDVLQVLFDRGYKYDASTFPTFLGPIARAYYFLHSGLGKQEKDKRKQLFGSWNAGFQRLRPYRWQFAMDQGKSLIEIPVTTLPWFKVPIHLSYVMYLATFSPWVARRYFYQACRFCWLNGVQPSLLLHPLDFMGCDDEKDLAFFPGMSSPSARKTDLALELLGWMSKQFECVTMASHAESIRTKLV
jgi:peptidoglycan-N-acetylglucosamine deacetylase